MKRTLVAIVVTASILPWRVQAQAPSESRYDSRFVQTPDVRLQYIDFAGDGLPLIFVQDIHNYFEDEEPYFREMWSGFYASFTDGHRVLATVRRGYGDSDAPDWGYDVATQAEDVLALMDALGIDRAVLVGRTPANQDMTWIAEHHPDRLAGLIYLGNPPVFNPPPLADARRFNDLYSLASCDLQERAAGLLEPRNSWYPHFLTHGTAQIDVPALRFTHPLFDRRSMSVQRIERLEQAFDRGTLREAECPGEIPYLAFVDSLASDRRRLGEIRRAFEESDLSVAVDEGLVRAFGEKMRTVLEPDELEGWEPLLEFYRPHMRDFLRQVAESESDRSRAR